MDITYNIDVVRSKVRAAAERAGRRPDEIQIIAVTKTVPEEIIKLAYAHGLKHLGENRIQEWQRKHLLLPEDCQWHIIGRLQTNKVKYLNERVAMIHSLDRVSLLEILNEEGQKRSISWQALVQVNVAQDEAKAGLKESEVKDFLLAARSYPWVKIRGLMTIGALDAGPEETRLCFRKLSILRDQLVSQGLGDKESLYHLSMGMSQDYEMAVEEGATIIRIGSVIFGHRV